MSETRDSEVKLISRKGGKLLLCGGHQYYKLKEYKSGSVIWRCSLYFKKPKCSGSLTLQGNDIVKKKPHVCQADYEKNKIAVSVSKLRNKVAKSDKPVPKLYNERLKKLILKEGHNSARNYPLFTNLQNSLYTTRNKSLSVTKTVFRNLEEVEVPAQFYYIILADYFYEGDRMLLFSTPEARQILATITEFFVDATFKACPTPFKELVSIHGEYGSSTETTRVIPVIFALMSNKSQSAYETMYDIIKLQLPQFRPNMIHCDFEIANINALLKIFPAIKIVGCYYHWHRCLWRKAESLLGKSSCRGENRVVSLCSVLPLLPREMLEEGWSYIKTECEHLSVEKFIKYIQNTWIKDKYLNLLSVFGMRHRTNNVLEGYHAKLNKIINKNNKKLLRLLNAINDDSLVKIVTQQFNKRRNRDIVNDDNIRHIQMQLLNSEISVGHALDKLR